MFWRINVIKIIICKIIFRLQQINKNTLKEKKRPLLLCFISFSNLNTFYFSFVFFSFFKFTHFDKK